MTTQRKTQRGKQQVSLREKYQYCAFYCEENIWKLCQESEFKDKTAITVFISNPQQTCAIWHQKAAPSVTEPVIFDYHVILLVKDEEQENKKNWQVWDLDTTLNFPINAETYFHETFMVGYKVPNEFQPQFRIINAHDYVLKLSSDRSHMKDENNNEFHPTPKWKAPYQADKGNNLSSFVQMEEGFLGEVLDLQMMFARFG